MKAAYLAISGLGTFEATMNGERIGNDIIPPAWMDYGASVPYVTYDVTKQLVHGDNVLGVQLGNGWFDYQTSSLIQRKGLGEGVPLIRHWGVMRVLAQLHIVYADGTTADTFSDPTWKAAKSPFTLAHVYGSESYDARLEQPGWNKPGFDDKAWVNAVAIEPPSGVLEAQSIPPVTVKQRFVSQRSLDPARQVKVFDIGQNINSQYEIELAGKAGQTIEIWPGEVLDSRSRVVPSKTNYATYSTCNLGGGAETCRLALSTAGFRYLEIRADNAEKLPRIDKVSATFTYSDSAEAGKFTASDGRYVQIHDLALKTLESNLMTIKTDCPTYEKLGWQEIVATTGPSYAYRYNIQPLWTQLARNTREAQQANGLVPNIVPAFTRGVASYDEAPAWATSTFAAP